MTYQKPQAEIIKFDFDGFMTASAIYNGITPEEVATSGLGGCFVVSWNATNSNAGGYPMINCGDVVFGNGTRKNDRVYSIPCKTYYA